MLEFAGGFGGAVLLALVTWLVYRRSAQHQEIRDYGRLTQEVSGIGALVKEMRDDVKGIKDDFSDMNGRLAFLEGKTNGQHGRGHHA